MGQSNGPSQRQLRVGELIRHELAQVFSRGNIHDPVIERTSLTVLEVKPSPDLKIATAYVRPLMGGKESELLEALNRHRRHIRGLLAPKLKLKFTPEIRFVIDTVLDQAGRIDAILRDPAVARDLAKDAGDEGTGTAS
ncbi:MAG: 30S ribosome-binding factor RbfA [Hyphomicrobiales bacterium]|nr:30S ribosome-binding factor RbfA [Hyphomicrobiales bacterium]